MTDGRKAGRPWRLPLRANRADISNLAALAGIQLGNALLPLVAYPFVLGVVGADRFSRIAVTESVMLMLLTVIAYSFDIDGVSRAVPRRADVHAVSLIFSEVLFARLALLAGAVVAILAVSPLFEWVTIALLLSWMLFPLGYILQGAWFFQSLERNGLPAALVITTRVLCLLWIYRVVSTPADYHWVPLIVGVTYAGGGAVLLVSTLVRHSIRLTPVSLPRIGELLLHGKEIFLGNISVVLYRDSNVLILNIFSSSAAVSSYAIAEKLIKVFQAGARPLNQLFFPKVIHALRDLRVPGPPALRTVLRYTIPQLSALALGVATIVASYYLLEDRLPAFFSSISGVAITHLVALMTAAVFVGVANFMFGFVGLNHLDGRRYLMKSILITGLCSIVLCVTLAHFFAATGAALSFVLAEVLLLAQILRAYA